MKKKSVRFSFLANNIAMPKIAKAVKVKAAKLKVKTAKVAAVIAKKSPKVVAVKAKTVAKQPKPVNQPRKKYSVPTSEAGATHVDRKANRLFLSVLDRTPFLTPAIEKQIDEQTERKSDFNDEEVDIAERIDELGLHGIPESDDDDNYNADDGDFESEIDDILAVN